MKGVKINFNINHITCFYDVETSDGVKTFLYGGYPSQTWDVEESSNTIIKLISEVESKYVVL